MMETSIEYRAQTQSYNFRYNSGITMVIMPLLLWMIFYPLVKGQGFVFFEAFHKFFLNKEIKIALFFLGLTLIAQLNGYYTTQQYPKTLSLKNGYLIFHFFNKKKLELKYSEIEFVFFTQDIFKNFEFIFKNGDKKIVYAAIKNKEEALKLIQKKIQYSNGFLKENKSN